MGFRQLTDIIDKCMKYIITVLLALSISSCYFCQTTAIDIDRIDGVALEVKKNHPQFENELPFFIFKSGCDDYSVFIGSTRSGFEYPDEFGISKLINEVEMTSRRRGLLGEFKFYVSGGGVFKKEIHQVIIR